MKNINNSHKKASIKQIVGRFAPSPTGFLHTGSLTTAVASWLMAKSAAGRWLLRIDDLDSPRLVNGAADDIMATLERFGLLWDGAISRQSRNIQDYDNVYSKLVNTGFVYPCGCSRREIASAASAPQQEDDCIRYPGICRSGIADDSKPRSFRIRVPEEPISFNDLCKGKICHNLAESCGDFPLRRADGIYSYQLAVVVDDYLGGVTEVVRGEDLLSSTPRQIYLQQLLNLPEPVYCHLPLVTGSDGSKLNKRNNLVSGGIKNWYGAESALLLAILRFLGQNPPIELDGADCSYVLEWGVHNFKVEKIPATGGELQIAR